jgi:hypothetical protein
VPTATSVHYGNDQTDHQFRAPIHRSEVVAVLGLGARVARAVKRPSTTIYVHTYIKRRFHNVP